MPGANNLKYSLHYLKQRKIQSIPAVVGILCNLPSLWRIYSTNTIDRIRLTISVVSRMEVWMKNSLPSHERTIPKSRAFEIWISHRARRARRIDIWTLQIRTSAILAFPDRRACQKELTGFVAEIRTVWSGWRFCGDGHVSKIHSDGMCFDWITISINFFSKIPHPSTMIQYLFIYQVFIPSLHQNYNIKSSLDLQLCKLTVCSMRSRLFKQFFLKKSSIAFHHDNRWISGHPHSHGHRRRNIKYTD